MTVRVAIIGHQNAMLLTHPQRLRFKFAMLSLKASPCEFEQFTLGEAFLFYGLNVKLW